MQYRHWMVWGMFLVVGIAGCGGTDQAANAPAAASSQAPGAQAAAESSASPEQTLAATTADPAGAMATFLDAVRCGDDAKTEAMFTPIAREKVSALGIQVAPPGSDTAKFEVGQVDMLADDGARVQSKWADVDSEGKQHVDEITWMVRKEKEGWRVAGMAATVFPGEPPMLLDFERPEETLQKVEMLKEEIRRRQEEAVRQAQQPEESKNSLRR